MIYSFFTRKGVPGLNEENADEVSPTTEIDSEQNSLRLKQLTFEDGGERKSES